MAKYTDKTRDEWDKLVEKWHEDAAISCSLQDYLELDDIEYQKMCLDIEDPEVTDEEIIEKSKQIAQDVVTELVIKPKLDNAIRIIL